MLNITTEIKETKKSLWTYTWRVTTIRFFFIPIYRKWEYINRR